MRASARLIIAAILVMSPMIANAAVSCDQFKAAISEGAAQYQAPEPKFWLWQANSAQADVQYFTVSMFLDTRSVVTCKQGAVRAFTVDADSADLTSVLHTMLLAAMGLRGYGLEWRQALEMRDQLVSLAKASDRQMSEVHVEGGKASLVISVAGVPSFQIDSDR